MKKTLPLLLLLLLLTTLIAQPALAKEGWRTAPSRWFQTAKTRMVKGAKSFRRGLRRIGTRTTALTTAATSAVLLAPAVANAAPALQQMQQFAATGNGKMVIAGGIAALVAAGGGTWAYLRGRGADKQWLRSDSHSLMRNVDTLAARDPSQLAGLVHKGRTAHQAAQHKLQAATSRKEKKQAQLDVAFSGMAAAYAALMLNVSSEDPAMRVGANPPKVWKQKLSAAETEAARSQSDGRVALLLKDLGKEVDHQRAVTERHRGALEGFEGAKPTFFAKNMKASLKRVTEAVGTFGKELDTEQKLLTAKTAAMRGRVSVRLAGKSTEFRDKNSYLGELDAFKSNKLGPVVDLAHNISSNLSAIADARQQESSYLAMAATRTHVPVPKTRTKYVNGKPVQEQYTAYEDQSSFYRMMAANEASRAQSNATEAQTRISSLNTHLRALRGHPILAKEGVQMPGERDVSVHHGRGWAGAYLLPPAFNLLGNLFSDTTSAISQFAPVSGALDHVASHIDGRRGQLRGWVNQKIDTRLASEMALAQAQ